MKGRIAIITDVPGWHGARLREAFAARGYQSRYLSLRDCRMALEEGSPGLLIPGFVNRLPDGVFIRGVPGGTLEQIVFHMDVLHGMEALGVPVYNDARAVERSVDKLLTSFLLRQAGLPVPPTYVCESEAEARAILVREIAWGREMVIKPLFGSQGMGLRRLRHPADLPPAEAYQGLYYLQRYLGPDRCGWHDWRVLVVGGRAVAAMKRHGRDWISNVAQGGRCEAAAAEGELAELAERAVSVLDMDYGGVDLMTDGDGRLVVIEVNSVPAWQGLQSVCSGDIARCLVDDFLDRHVAPPSLGMVGR
jgi:tetrahydromethanopterin:alpha-L-glutamate ligase